MTDVPVGVALTLSAAAGLVMGSFLNCLAWRLVHGESVLHGRSHCTSCGHPLGPLDLIPVVSWAALGGRCRYCAAPVSPRYPLAELTCGAVYVSAVWQYGVSWAALRMAILGSVLLCASLVDLEDGWIPDRLLIAGAVGWILLLLPDPNPLSALRQGLVGAIALFLPLLAIVLAADRVIGQESMGGGDLKLFALLGLFFGWQKGLLAVILSCAAGLVSAVLMGRARPGQPFPFGPAIAAAAWITALWGDLALQWYLSLFP